MRQLLPSLCTLFATWMWLIPVTGVTAPFPVTDVPQPLEDWIPWVLDAAPERECPMVDGAATCAWPGELRLDLGKDGGAFSLMLQMDHEGSVRLPGDTEHWPQSVTLDGKPAVVLMEESEPSAFVPSGAHLLSGRFTWSRTPEGLLVPPSIALVSLRISGKEVSSVRREPDGRLWLTAQDNEASQAETLDLTVMRKLVDAVPMRVETRLLVRASGKAREVALPGALPDGVVTLSVDSELPARIESDGTLRLQVRAGTYSVTIVGRLTEKVDTVLAPSAGAPWPSDEVWVFEGDPALRQVSVTGAPGIDPSRTNLPLEWRALPAYQLEDGGSLTLVTDRRGEPEPAPDDLSLSRDIWLDLDGAGFTFRDRLSGTLGRSTRLELLEPGVLGSVSLGSQAQLVTLGPKSNRSGVELRDAALDLNAEWRLPGSSKKLRAVGWSEDVSSLSATLHLPPGFTLLGASGVDELPDTWWESWNLFSFFFVLIMSLAVGKLTKWWVGLLTLVAMVLAHNEDVSPTVAWIPLLVTLGLLLVLPEGRFKFAARLAWWVSVIVVALVFVPFSVDEVRVGLYPQIDEDGASYYSWDDTRNMDFESPNAPAAQALEEEQQQEPSQKDDDDEDKPKMKAKGGDDGRREVEVQIQALGRMQDEDVIVDQVAQRSLAASNAGLSYKKVAAPKALQQDPKAIVQTGHGVPNWRWKQWSLGWSGPVDAGHHMRLYLLTPVVNLVLKLLEVLLLLGITLLVVRRGIGVGVRLGPPSRPTGDEATPPSAEIHSKVAATTALIVGLLAPLSSSAQGSLPDSEMLDELRSRLTRTDDCPDACVSISTLSATVRGDTLSLTSEVHAAVRTSVRLPGPASSFVPARVTVDGKPTAALRLDDEGFIHVRLEAGRHVVQAEGRVPNVATLTLELKDLPHLAKAVAPGWTVDGIDEDGQPDSSIQLARVATDSSASPSFEESTYAAFFEVERNLDLGLPWLVSTTVRRLTPLGSAAVVRVPLLPGESVTESNLQVEAGEVVVSLSRDQAEVSWSSTLQEAQTLTLVAPSGKPLSEVWTVSCSPIQQCDFAGPPPVRRKDGTALRPTFRPWPSEKLEVSTRKPKGAPGQSVTVDSAELEVSPGTRMLTARLSLQVRTSRGGLQKLELPPEASIMSVTVGGASQPFSPEDRALRLTLNAGSQEVLVLWQQQGGLSNLLQVPPVKVDGQVANVKIVLNLPEQRWLLWAGGPSWGPAILFWGYLLTILVGGVVLGRISLSPLKSWQWVLLALGLTQVPVGVSLVIVGWFFALEWRARNVQPHFVAHNILQVVLGVWTLVAAICLVGSIYSGLAVQPDMQVEGNGCSNSSLVWFVDRAADTLPTPWALSAPILLWKVIMLAWALWLAWSVVQWAPWAFKRWSHEIMWRPMPKPEKPPS